MDGYRWIYTDRGGLLQIKQETKHCNGTRNATPYMVLTNNYSFHFSQISLQR